MTNQAVARAARKAVVYGTLAASGTLGSCSEETKTAAWDAGADACELDGAAGSADASADASSDSSAPGSDPLEQHALALLRQGREIFRFDTFGDEAFWGGQLKLHRAVAGEAQGG